ncbi:MAG: DNRLRE domain-containing protein [Gaiellaceae bacterium]
MPSAGRGLRMFGGVVSALTVLAALAAVAAAAADGSGGAAGAGRHHVRVYAAPVEYRDAGGALRPIDNTLVADSSGNVTNAANSYVSSLPPDAGAPVSFSTERGSVSFQLDGASGQRTVDGSHASYAGALPGVDVAYAVGNAGVKETLTLAASSAPASFDYSLTVSAGLTPRLNRSGGIDFVDASGSVAFAFAPPSMTDAAGVSTNRIRFHLSHGGGRLTLSADRSWLAEPNRAWPVVVDPSFIADGADRECFIRNGVDASASFCGGSSVDVGTDGAQTSRTLLVWDLSSIVPANATVQSATLGLYLQGESTTSPLSVGVHHATAPWTVSATWNEADTGIAWGTPGGDFVASPDATATVGGATGVTATWDLKSLVQGWADGSVANDGMILEGSGGTNVLHFATTSAPTSQMPYLDVTYDTTPQTTITSGPGGTTSTTSASFGFTSDTYGSTFECSLDNVAFTACSSPQRYSALAVGSHTFAVRATSPGGTVDPTPAARSWTITSAPANLLANGSFEGSLAGWAGSGASLSPASDGVVGPGAARVTRTSGSSFSIVAAPRPVSSTTAGGAYSAGGWIRSDRAGRTVCLVVREWTAGGSLVGSRSSCATAGRGWQQLAGSRYVAARSGDSLDVAVTQSGAIAGDSFEADGLTLTQG